MRHFALVGRGQIAGEAVQIDGELRGIRRVQQLREPRGHHAGQHVSGAAGRHAGVAGQVDVRLPVGRRHDRPVPLQDT